MEQVRIFSDGASRGNPGPAGIGVAIVGPGGNSLAEVKEYLGVSTNNLAEYTALIRGLETALGLGARKVEIFSDSELLVRQVCGQYQVRSLTLKPLHRQVLSLARRFAEFRIQHVPRSQNARADELANQAIDEAIRGGHP